jgi:transposase, IS30 family
MQPHYSHIAPSDRISIQALLAAKFSCRAIARQLNFHHSSVCREVNRAKACATASTASYRAGHAQERSAARRTAAGAARRKLGADVQTPLWRCVIDGLRCRWSPEQIAGKLRAMKPPVNHPIEALLDSPYLGAVNALHVSHETIYCAIYAMPRGTMRSELVALLCKSHKTRLPRARGSARAGGK